jgi:hypothetical protein
MNAHTKEPWAQHVDEPDAIVAVANPHESLLTVDGDYGMAKLYNVEDARRIVACVNACAGIPTEQLEQSHRNHAVTHLVEEIARLTKQRDELVKALKDLMNTLTDGPDESDIARVFTKARAALASIHPNAQEDCARLGIDPEGGMK